MRFFYRPAAGKDGRKGDVADLPELVAA